MAGDDDLVLPPASQPAKQPPRPSQGRHPARRFARLGEGDGYLSRRVRERRGEGVDIDNVIASAFVEGFRGLPEGSFDAREATGSQFLGGVDARAVLQARAQSRAQVSLPKALTDGQRVGLRFIRLRPSMQKALPATCGS